MIEARPVSHCFSARARPSLHPHRWIVALEFAVLCGLAIAIVGGCIESMRAAWVGILAVVGVLCIQSADSFLTATNVQVREPKSHAWPLTSSGLGPIVPHHMLSGPHPCLLGGPRLLLARRHRHLMHPAAVCCAPLRRPTRAASRCTPPMPLPLGSS
jgi:hypothetical protein